VAFYREHGYLREIIRAERTKVGYFAEHLDVNWHIDSHIPSTNTAMRVIFPGRLQLLSHYYATCIAHNQNKWEWYRSNDFSVTTKRLVSGSHLFIQSG
jgi:hypothetical protein